VWCKVCACLSHLGNAVVLAFGPFVASRGFLLVRPALARAKLCSMAYLDNVEVDRPPTKQGWPRAPLRIQLMLSNEGVRWNILGGRALFSELYPTREAAIQAARLRDGLGPTSH
jgi:hypothetical protein